jgi:hypothetical protein
MPCLLRGRAKFSSPSDCDPKTGSVPHEATTLSNKTEVLMGLGCLPMKNYGRKALKSEQCCGFAIARIYS